jgi:hypothetical protein
MGWTDPQKRAPKPDRLDRLARAGSAGGWISPSIEPPRRRYLLPTLLGIVCVASLLAWAFAP